MSGINALNRITGSTNNLVYMQTTDTMETALGANYITNQAANINLIQEGGFTWLTNDLIFVSAADGVTICTINSAFTSLFSYQGGPAGYVITPITLTAFLASYTTPVLCVSAPAAGQLLIVDSAQIVQVYGSAALAGGGATYLQYGNTTQGGGVKASTSVAAADLEQTASTVYPMIGISGSGNYFLDASCAGKGLYLSNPTAVFTGGTGSTFFVKTKFHIINTLS